MNRGTCERCGRERFIDRFLRKTCIHGSYFVCKARASCKAAGKKARREARS